jgi:hypothetical protein
MNAYSLTTHTNGTLARMEETRQAHPSPFTPARAVTAVGDELTRRGLAALAVEHLQAALFRVVELAYEEDVDGRLCNVDSHDGRLLIPVPWGSVGHRRYGLRRREADVLRFFLLERMTPRPGAPVPLFQYDHERRAWFVNLADYSTRAIAGSWLKQSGLTVRAYKECLRRVQEASSGRP